MKKKLVIITGMSGAGKNTALNILQFDGNNFILEKFNI